MKVCISAVQLFSLLATAHWVWPSSGLVELGGCGQVVALTNLVGVVAREGCSLGERLGVGVCWVGRCGSVLGG